MLRSAEVSLLSPPLLLASTPAAAHRAAWLLGAVLLMVLLQASTAPGMPTEHAASSLETADYPDYQTGVRYDEYPLVVPKRTALMLDKMMVALQRALDDDVTTASAAQPEQQHQPHQQLGGGAPPRSGTTSTSRTLPLRAPPPRGFLQMDLQRRNQQKGRVYLRCYFNAVSCFKKRK